MTSKYNLPATPGERAARDSLPAVSDFDDPKWWRELGRTIDLLAAQLARSENQCNQFVEIVEHQADEIQSMRSAMLAAHDSLPECGARNILAAAIRWQDFPREDN